MMRLILSLLCLIAGTVRADGFDHQYPELARAWSTCVKDGAVDYAGLKDNPNDLLEFCNRVELLDRETYDAFGSNEKLAFLINVYNAYAVRMVMDRFPVTGVRDMDGFYGQKGLLLFRDRISLDDVVQLIDGERRDLRVRCALTGAARGYPALPEEVFTPGDLEQQLERSAQAFLADTARNRIMLDRKNTIYVSEIFKTFDRDFIKNKEQVAAFIRRHTGMGYAELPRMKYLDFDWRLNGR